MGAVVVAAGCSSSRTVEVAPCETTEETTRPWPRPSASEGVLHVVTWNLHGLPFAHGKSQRLERVATVLLDREPDLVLLQEVWVKGDVRLLVERLKSKYKQVAYDTAVAWSFLEILGLRKSGLLAFYHTPSQWSPKSSVFREYHAGAPWWRLWQLDGISGKGIQRIELEFNGPGHRVIVLNTHLQSPYTREDPPFLCEYPYDKERGEQIIEIAKYADEPEKHGIAMTAAGDFNTTQGIYNNDAKLYGEMTRTWKDLTKDYRDEHKTGTIMDKNGQRKDWIDYILWRTAPGPSVSLKRMRLICNVAMDDPYSDHHGLEAQLVIPAGE